MLPRTLLILTTVLAGIAAPIATADHSCVTHASRDQVVGVALLGINTYYAANIQTGQAVTLGIWRETNGISDLQTKPCGSATADTKVVAPLAP